MRLYRAMGLGLTQKELQRPLPDEVQKPAELERLAGLVPLRRNGSPADITRTLLFLISSPYMTGHTVFVDGGAHLK